MQYIKYFFFSGLYFYICNWFQIGAFVKHLSQPKKLIKIIRDNQISSLVKNKTGLSLKRIIVFNSEKMFGMMPGIPLWPELILSSRMIKELNKDELEWVILHEVAHCVFWHVPKTFLIQVFVWAIGLWLTSLSQSLILVLLFSLTLSLLSIQVFRLLEWEADKFAINNVDNPQGVITAQEKFKKLNGKLSFYQKGIFRQLFYWNILPAQRIELAQKRTKNESS